MAEYIDTQETDLLIGDGASPEAFTSIPNITEIDGPTAQASEKDTTHLKSVAMENRPGLVDFGSITAEMMYDERDAVHSGLRDKLVARTTHNFQLKDAGSPVKTYDAVGWVKGLPLSFPINEVVRSSMEVRLSGNVVAS